ncbi:unnamed protein product [Darwinula stevensoni]|uniref:GB1/RHD3-type G domain-containing protein n=1 Tax=Darwinula stevensoni TaxID=69355 RepID=A0A7R8XGB0_9CRUS|nr:unnamed protein product [Darwinula stevensoni]CAG0891477.1 unnamed protein product [Darwinula stevensoni]
MEEHPIRGSAICVVEHKEFEGKDSYLLKEDRLRQLLLQAHCRDKPVAVVSIAGGARRGKSFLLSLFLRYLRAQGSEDWLENEDFPNKGFAWRMSSKGVTTGIHIWDEIFTIRLQNGEETGIRRLPPSPTAEFHAKGTQISQLGCKHESPPPPQKKTIQELVEIPESFLQACILLMDTEGTFDSEKSLAHSVTVFALSTLLSSVQIYNLKENINMDDLLHLQVWFP